VEKLGGSGDLLKMSPYVVAAQLTLIDTEIFLQIQPREFTNQSWQKRPDLSSAELLIDDNDDEEEDTKRANKFDLYEKLQKLRIDAPNLLYMIDHVNRLSLWVATEILSRTTHKEMADMITYFYVVAEYCLNLHNVHTCTAIFGGICFHTVTRLRRVNKLVSDQEQIQGLHKVLTEMVCSDANYKRYRTFSEQWYNDRERQRPCIPFIPVLVKDLFNIQLAMVQRVKLESDSGDGDGEKHVDLGLLEKNCRAIRRAYEAQQRAKLYANTLPKDTDVQSTLRMNIAKFEMQETLRVWSYQIQPKLTKEDRENLEMIETLEQFGFV